MSFKNTFDNAAVIARRLRNMQNAHRKTTGGDPFIAKFVNNSEYTVERYRGVYLRPAVSDDYEYGAFWDYSGEVAETGTMLGICQDIVDPGNVGTVQMFGTALAIIRSYDDYISPPEDVSTAGFYRTASETGASCGRIIIDPAEDDETITGLIEIGLTQY